MKKLKKPFNIIISLALPLVAYLAIKSTALHIFTRYSILALCIAFAISVFEKKIIKRILFALPAIIAIFALIGFEPMFFISVFFIAGCFSLGFSPKYIHWIIKKQILFRFCRACIAIGAFIACNLLPLPYTGDAASEGYITGSLLTFCIVVYIPIVSLIIFDWYNIIKNKDI